MYKHTYYSQLKCSLQPAAASKKTNVYKKLQNQNLYLIAQNSGLKAENEKLRELCAELYEFVSSAERLQFPELADCMKELGIGVES